MSVARHKLAPELEGVGIDDIAERYTRRYRDITPDWEAFEDAKVEGYKRAQHRFIGAGGSGKHHDPLPWSPYGRSRRPPRRPGRRASRTGPTSAPRR